MAAVTLSPTSIRPAGDEPKLVAATRAGDDRAFGELYARYRERIFAFILSRVHDHGRAEDIAQDVFISALKRMRAGDQEIAFKPWIYEIAKNACIDEYRRGSRSREVPLETDSDSGSGSGSGSGGAPPPLSLLPTPPAAVESKQRLDDLRGAFGGLSETHHQLLVLREFEGLSYDEIGERLDMTRQMVESGLFRARRKLTEEYAELASGRRCEQVQFAIEAGTLASARALGIRDRRRFARHLSHCQACRHVALMAGVDEALVRPRSIAAKIAALLPFPLARLRWPWGSAPVAPVADQAGNSASALGPAAVAAAALAIAGVGGSLLHNAVASGHAGAPSATRSAATQLGRASGAGSGGSSLSSSTGAVGVSHGASFGGVGVAGVRGGYVNVLSGPSHGSHGAGAAAARPSASTSSTGGSTSRGSTLRGATKTVTAPVKQVVSGLGTTTHQVLSTTTQQLGSTTRRVVSGAAGAVGKTAGTVTSTASKAVQGVAGAVKGATSSGSSSGSSSSSSSSPSPSSSSSSSAGQGTGTTPSPASVVSTATQPVSQVAGQATQAVGKAVPGLPH